MSTEGTVSDTTVTEATTTAVEVVEGQELATEVVNAPDDIVPAIDGTPEVIDKPLLKYGELDVTVDVPDDLREQLAKSELDADALVAELYGGDEFGLSDDTKNKLYSIYGKTVVDSFLSQVKQGNDSLLQGEKEALAAKEAADAESWSAALEVVGGEEGWNAIESFALETLTDEQLSEFNDVMNSGSKYAQRLALKDLKAAYEDKEGTGSLVLVEGKGGVAVEKNHLTAAEYHELIRSGEYRKSPEKYDNMRRAGMKAGIN